MKTEKYKIENLDCAHCGAKIEKLIGEIDGVNEAALSFPMMPLTVSANDPDALLPEMIRTAVMILGITGIYSNMWLAVFADTGVAFLCILNSVRMLFKKIK